MVGSNAGGPGQTELRYAEDDARRVGARADRARRLRARHGRRRRPPDAGPAARPAREARASASQADVAAGRQARVFFYYSGHARAHGDRSRRDRAAARRAAPAPVRGRRRRSPSSCSTPVRAARSRASRARNPPPTSRSARASTSTRPASRCSRRQPGSELSQESEQLRRRTSRTTCWSACAAPATRTATARSRSTRPIATRITRRCSRPPRPRSAASTSRSRPTSRATARCRCRTRAPRPRRSCCRRALEGQTLVEDRRAHAVVAETYKAKGAAVRIAVAPGDYDVLVRHGDYALALRGRPRRGADRSRSLPRARRSSPTRRKGGARLGDPHRASRSPARRRRASATTRTPRTSRRSATTRTLAPPAGFALTGLRQVRDELWVGGAAERRRLAAVDARHRRRATACTSSSTGASRPRWSRLAPPSDARPVARLVGLRAALGAGSASATPQLDRRRRHDVLDDELRAGVRRRRRRFTSSSSATLGVPLGLRVRLRAASIEGPDRQHPRERRSPRSRSASRTRY